MPLRIIFNERPPLKHICMVLALFGGHRFIHDLTSSKMLWWKICVPDPNPKKTWLALSIRIWKIWCWNTIKQVMCPQLLLDHKDIGTWNSSAQLTPWDPTNPQPSTALVGRTSFGSQCDQSTHQSMTQSGLISCFGWSFKNLHWGANPICANKAQNNSGE